MKEKMQIGKKSQPKSWGKRNQTAPWDFCLFVFLFLGYFISSSSYFDSIIVNLVYEFSRVFWQEGIFIEKTTTTTERWIFRWWCKIVVFGRQEKKNRNSKKKFRGAMSTFESKFFDTLQNNSTRFHSHFFQLSSVFTLLFLKPLRCRKADLLFFLFLS